jgi:hypothetical protein
MKSVDVMRTAIAEEQQSDEENKMHAIRLRDIPILTL